LQRLVHDPSPAHLTLALAPDGTTLAAWPRPDAPDRCLSIVSLDDGQRRCLGRPPIERALLSFSSDGRRLLALTQGAAEVWDVARGVAWSPSMDIPLTDAALEPGGEVLVSMHESPGTRRLMRWPIPLDPPPSLAGHEGRVSELVLTDAGRRLASAGNDGTVRQWDLEERTGEVLARLPGEVMALAAASDGTLAWSDGARIDVRAPDGSVRGLPLAPGQVTDLAFTDPDELLVSVRADPSASEPARFAMIDLRTDRIGPLTEIRVRSASLEQLGRGAAEALVQRLHPEATARLEGEAFSFVTKDGGMVIDVAGELRFRATDLATNEQWVLDPQALQPMHTPLPRLHVDRNHLVVVTGANIVVWDPRAGTTSSLPHHHDRHWITALAISPDGERLVIGDGDGLIHVLGIALPEGEALRDWAERAVELRTGPGDEP
jgi:WD40 repeat protein